MILKLYKENHDSYDKRISYYFMDSTGKEFASATNNSMEDIKLYVSQEEYTLLKRPKIVMKKPSNFIWPRDNKWKKIIGFVFLHDNNIVAYNYWEGLVCEKRRFLDRTIGTTAHVYQDVLYFWFQVGFWPKEMDHYYCLYQGMNLVGMVQRHNRPKDNCIATIYIENEDYTLINLFACTEEMVHVTSEVNPSIGPYASRYEEEKALVDRDFIERVKKMG